MRTVTVHEAKTQLSNLIRAVENGEEVIIARGRVPKVRLVLLEEAKPERQLGTATGLIEMGDDFDEPLEDFGEYQ